MLEEVTHHLRLVTVNATHALDNYEHNCHGHIMRRPPSHIKHYYNIVVLRIQHAPLQECHITQAMHNSEAKC